MILLKDILLGEDHGDNLKNGYWGNSGAGVLPIAIESRRFLICHRSPHVQEPNTFNVWGGAIDDDENPKESAKREFMEETGFDRKLELIPAYVFKASNGKFTYYNFIGILKNEFEPTLDWESQGYEWLTYDELSNLRNKHFGLNTLLKESNILITNILKSIEYGKYRI